MAGHFQHTNIVIAAVGATRYIILPHTGNEDYAAAVHLHYRRRGGEWMPAPELAHFQADYEWSRYVAQIDRLEGRDWEYRIEVVDERHPQRGYVILASDADTVEARTTRPRA